MTDEAKTKSLLKVALERHPVLTSLVLLAPLGFILGIIAAFVPAPEKRESGERRGKPGWKSLKREMGLEPERRIKCQQRRAR